MKKLLIIFSIIVLCILTILTMLNGFQIGNMQVLGFQGMKVQKEELSDKIRQASELTSKDYSQKLGEVTSSASELKKEKDKYEDNLIYSTEEEIQKALSPNPYEVEFLWAQIGKHATAQGVNLKLEILKGTTNNYYNLQFTATGGYIGLTDFIYALEDDSDLEFKIENFKLVPNTATATTTTTNNNNNTANNNTANNNTATNNTNTTTSAGALKATFIVKDVLINLKNVSTTTNESNNNTVTQPNEAAGNTDQNQNTENQNNINTQNNTNTNTEGQANNTAQ